MFLCGKFDDSPVLFFCQSLVLGCSSPRMFDVCYHDVSRFDHEFVSVIDGKSRRDIFNYFTQIRKNVMFGAGFFFFCRQIRKHDVEAKSPCFRQFRENRRNHAVKFSMSANCSLMRSEASTVWAASTASAVVR